MPNNHFDDDFLEDDEAYLEKLEKEQEISNLKASIASLKKRLDWLEETNSGLINDLADLYGILLDSWSLDETAKQQIREKFYPKEQ